MLNRKQAQEVRDFLHSKRIGRPVILLAISYANLRDDELQVLMLRHLHGHTQERVAEELGVSTNTVYNKEHSALECCYHAWKTVPLVIRLMDAARE